MTSIETGRNIGHISSAKIKKTTVEIFFKSEYSGLVRDSQMIPSVNCWIESNSGIDDKVFNPAESEFFIETDPISASAALAPKLAVAEKHIADCLLSCGIA
nr:hypothetical protein [Daejeonella sp. H1SJ63]